MIKKHIHYYLPKKYLLTSPDFNNPMVDVLDLTAHIEQLIRAYTNSNPAPTPPSYSFLNGIQSSTTGSVTEVGLGGTLIRPVEIYGNSQSFDISNLDTFSIDVNNFIGVSGNPRINASVSDVEVFSNTIYYENNESYSISSGINSTNDATNGYLSISANLSRPTPQWTFSSITDFEPFISMELIDSYDIIESGSVVANNISGLFKSYKNTNYSQVNNREIYTISSPEVPSAIMLFNNLNIGDFSKRNEVFLDIDVLSLKKEDMDSSDKTALSSIEITSESIDISSRKLKNTSSGATEDEVYGSTIKLKSDGNIGIYKSYNSVANSYNLPRPLNSDNYESKEISFGTYSKRVYGTLDYRDLHRHKNPSFFSDKIIKSEVTKMLVINSGENISEEAHLIIPNSSDDLFIKEIILHYSYESMSNNTIYINIKNGMHDSSADDLVEKLVYEPTVHVDASKWRTQVFSANSFTDQGTKAINSVTVPGTTLNKTNDLLIVNLSSELVTDAILSAYVTIKYEVLQTKF